MAEQPVQKQPVQSRTLVVTGATSGIGAAICRQLLLDGHQVLGMGRDFSRWPAEQASGFTACPVNLDDLDGLPKVLEELLRRHREVDGAVLAAGRGLLGHLEQLSYAQIRQLMDLNFTSQAYVARALMPHLKARGGGDLIFIGSEAAFEGKRQGAVYCASKFALRGFAQALREEGAKRSVRVTQIHPGVVRTPFFDGLHISPGPADEHALDADDVAAAVRYVLSLRPGAVVEELRLAPRQQAVVFDRNRRTDGS